MTMRKKLFLALFLFFYAQSAYTLTDGFERGAFASNWVSYGDTKWKIATDRKYTGRYSAKVSSTAYATTVSILQTSTISSNAGTVSFYARTSSSSAYNKLKFYIDGVGKVGIAGSTNWRKYTFYLGKGNHTLRWEYHKDSSYSDGVAWIDNIKAPAEDFTVHNSVSYDQSCKQTANSIWVGDFKGPITSLSKSNFKVYVNNSRVYTFNFSKSTPTPVATSLVMDYSGSMSSTDIRNAESAAVEYVRLMRGADASEVIKFATSIRIMQSFTASKSSLYSAIAQDPYTGAVTSLYDAILRGLRDASATASTKKKAVIVYTDGWENNSSATINDVINFANSRSIPVYTIGLGDAIDESSLKRIAKETGGLYFKAPTSKDLLTIYNSIKGGLSGLYRISFENKEATIIGAEIRINTTYNGKQSHAINRAKGCVNITPILLYLLKRDHSEDTYTDPCITTISFGGSKSGKWLAACPSTHRLGSYAKYYRFKLHSPRNVQIDLASSIDAYLFLLSGAGKAGTVIALDDDSGDGRNSRIIRTLDAGEYTIEATTYSDGQTGDFNISIQ